MSFAIVRLALLQFVVVVLSVLLVGFTLKARFGSGSHFPILATYVRDYGIFLLLLPTAWGVWGALRSNRPLAGAGDAGLVFVSGIVLFAFLVCLGFFAFISASSYRSLIMVVPQQSPAAATPSPEHP